MLLLDVLIQGSGARITGQPRFSKTNQLKFDNSSTHADVGLQSDVNKNINLNGGTINLIDNLNLAKNVVLAGGGTIKGNGNKVVMGGTTAVSWPSATYTWRNRAMIELNGDVNLTGDWTLNDGTHILGNGYVLDITSGSLTIPAGATVYMRDVMVEGFTVGAGPGAPKIFFGNASQLRISNVDLGMQLGTGDVDLTIGGIYVEGESAVLCRGRRLRFTSAASLTVDGVALNAEPLGATSPFFPIFPSTGDPQHVNVINKGVIRRFGLGVAGSTVIDNSVTNIGAIEISLDNKLLFTQSTTYSGGFNTFNFATAGSPLVILSPNVMVEIQSVLLRAFQLNYINFGAGSSFVFGPNTSIILAQSSVDGFPCENLTHTYTFRGDVVIDGNNHCWDLGDDSLPGPKGNLVIRPGSSLSIQNLTIKNLSGNKIRCLDDTSVLALRNVTLIMDGDFSFTRGSLWIQQGTVDIQGSYTFAYTTSQASFIFNQGRLQISDGATFLYAPRSNNRELIVFEDETSRFDLENGTLASTRTGIRLTIGAMDVKGRSFLTQNLTGTLSLSESIAFGDGNPSNEINVSIAPGASLELLRGRLVYDQAA